MYSPAFELIVFLYNLEMYFALLQLRTLVDCQSYWDLFAIIPGRLVIMNVGFSRSATMLGCAGRRKVPFHARSPNAQWNVRKIEQLQGQVEFRLSIAVSSDSKEVRDMVLPCEFWVL